MENSISGKVVVVTGASSGIGRAIAVALSKAGAKVVLSARRENELKAIIAEIKAFGGIADYVVTDIKNKADVFRLTDFAIEKFGFIDVMINNAGVAHLSRIDETDIDGWEEMIDVNLKGVLYGFAAVMTVFKKQQHGHIINIISTSGIKISPLQGVYAGTKNAVRTIAEAFRQESDGKIRITGISPGYVKTNLVDTVKDVKVREAVKENMAKLAIAPESIANAVIYAISQPQDVEVGDIVIRPAIQD
ncbi:SDR family oxidoreductase [Flavobacterium rhizosphaerae]|uniref:SDR family oxidoreductase n=1 Tax=Flavobacterium rhizosphaerae TaxID=3163298 RepID=A0ABW8YXQ6_9FLAO